MNRLVHNFAIAIPADLWKRLQEHCEPRTISAFVIEAIREKLEEEV